MIVIATLLENTRHHKTQIDTVYASQWPLETVPLSLASLAAVGLLVSSGQTWPAWEARLPTCFRQWKIWKQCAGNFGFYTFLVCTTRGSCRFQKTILAHWVISTLQPSKLAKHPGDMELIVYITTSTVGFNMYSMYSSIQTACKSTKEPTVNDTTSQKVTKWAGYFGWKPPLGPETYDSVEIFKWFLRFRPKTCDIFWWFTWRM